MRHVAGFVTALLMSGTASAQRLDVQPPVRVSPPGAGAHFWWTVDASRSDADHLVVCGLRNQPQKATWGAVLYGSEDGGSTWKTLLTDFEGSSVSEVSCAFGAGRTLYFTSTRGLGLPMSVLKDRKQFESWKMRRSLDFGASWRESRHTRYLDNVYAVVHPGADVDRDRLYLFGDGYKREMEMSFDGANTLAFRELPDRVIDPPPGASGKPFRQVVWTAGAVTLPDGMLGAFYLDPMRNPTAATHLTVSRLRPDDGVADGPAIVIATLSRELDSFSNLDHNAPGTTSSRFERDGPTFHTIRFPSVAVGPRPGRSSRRVYIAWHDVTAERIRILLATSDDSGRTWSAPRVVDDLPADTATRDSARDQAASHPSIAVNSDGIVGLQWAEFDGQCWRFTASRDGGATFGPSVPLNCFYRPTPQAYSRHLNTFMFAPSMNSVPRPPGAWPKDTLPGSKVSLSVIDFRSYNQYTRGTGLCATRDKSFHAAWTSFGDRGTYDLYMTRIGVDDAKAEAKRKAVAAAVDALASKPSAAASAAWLDYTQVEFDETLNEFRVGAVVVTPRNTQPKWPLVLRARNLQSVLGPLTAVAADNGLDKEGAAWIFEGPAQSLPAGTQAFFNLSNRSNLPEEHFEFSQPRTLYLRLNAPPRDPHPPFPFDWGKPMVKVEADVLEMGDRS